MHVHICGRDEEKKLKSSYIWWPSLHTSTSSWRLYGALHAKYYAQFHQHKLYTLNVVHFTAHIHILSTPVPMNETYNLEYENTFLVSWQTLAISLWREKRWEREVPSLFWNTQNVKTYYMKQKAPWMRLILLSTEYISSPNRLKYFSTGCGFF